MKPKKSSKNVQLDLFKVELMKLISPDHELVILSKKIDWNNFDNYFGKSFHPTHGRPGLPTRLMVGLHYLKYGSI